MTSKRATLLRDKDYCFLFSQILIVKKSVDSLASLVFCNSGEIMTVPIEDLPSPYEVWMMADAIYEDNGLFKKTEDAINDHIKKHSNGKIHLIELRKDITSTWVFGLFKVDIAGRKALVVSFCGTKNLRDWVDNLTTPNLKLASRIQILRMSKVVKDWEKQYTKKYKEKYGKPEWGKIVALTGHSRGGQFAGGCYLDHPVWRITWNGFAPGEGDEHINLGTENDPLSKKISPISKIKICEGGHGIDEFKKRVKTLNWTEILLMKKKVPPYLAKL